MAPPAEISIPTTSLHTPADGGKPYTLYNITLRLPLRSFVVQKRYSDFAALHATLTSQIGTPPPAPLPPKAWLKSTVSSPELTEQRRAALETYLRAVAEPPDRRWRDTAAWRAFLNLPSGSTGTSAASASGVHAISAASSSSAAPRDANVAAAAADPGVWLDLHRELKDALHEARRALARRDALAGASSSVALTSSSDPSAAGSARIEAAGLAKRCLVRAASLLGALNDGLRALKDGGRLGDGELRRRRDLLAAARNERDGLEKLSASLATVGGGGVSAGGGFAVAGGGRQGVPSASDKAALLGSAPSATSSSGSGGGPRAGGRVLGAPLPETERSRELDNAGVLRLQEQMMQEQDDNVEVLAKIVRRQREMGLQIHDEVDEQIRLMDQMSQDVDRVAGKVKVAKNKTKQLGR